MLTEQFSGKETSDEAFETRDFYLACFLKCRGYELIGLRAEERHRVFVFRDRRARGDDVLGFYGDAIDNSDDSW
ncbi:DUF5659 domain-containing protein [Nitrosospira multiformis]|uniref:DUF5659 domain-containing protein n=1 Tax=Nitrosospira multiformis TaxID=1231 RepID=A0A1I7HII6_9PROT|nr:hypothetical protein SAMN05216417_10996 [Nitrosospira multiformis]